MELQGVRARFIVGDTLTVLRSMSAGSVDSVITSPPYPWQRSYLPPDHPDKHLELGQEATPGEALEALLGVMDELWRVLADDGTFWVNLGDVHAGSGGAGGDYNDSGLRDGQQRFDGTARKALRYPKAVAAENEPGPRRQRFRSRTTPEGWPREQSVCCIPALFQSSLAYGRNLLTGQEHQQWVVRPPVTWCKPSPSVGQLTRKFRTATELFIYGGKHQQHYFDLDAVRTEPTEPGTTKVHNDRNWSTAMGRTSQNRDVRRIPTNNPKGAPPLNYWIVNHPGYPEAHFATFPPELLVRPVLAGCPEGGVILDPFAGTFTVGMVATGHGRGAIGIDLDARNADLARHRVGMWLEVQEAVA